MEIKMDFVISLENYTVAPHTSASLEPGREGGEGRCLALTLLWARTLADVGDVGEPAALAAKGRRCCHEFGWGSGGLTADGPSLGLF